MPKSKTEQSHAGQNVRDLVALENAIRSHHTGLIKALSHLSDEERRRLSKDIGQCLIAGTELPSSLILI